MRFAGKQLVFLVHECTIYMHDNNRCTENLFAEPEDMRPEYEIVLGFLSADGARIYRVDWLLQVKIGERFHCVRRLAHQLLE